MRDKNVEEAVWSTIHDHRFHTAEHAEVCKGKLREEFGYQAVTKAAEEVLEGTYRLRNEAPHDFGGLGCLRNS